jgi:polyisoprenoid-binding protein YceI
MLVRILAAAVAAPSLLFFTAAAPVAGARSPAHAELRLVVAPTGNEVRYRVREQLAGFDLPNDAVGKTAAVTGGITFDPNGALVPAASKVTVDVQGLSSDRSRRDGYVRARVLETAQYPTVTLAPTAVTGLSWPLPTSGSRTFQLTGDLTVHGTTHPTTWNVTATFDGSDVTGTAITGFTFDDFGLARPRVPIVLSVADSIHLEYEFHLVPEGK